MVLNQRHEEIQRKKQNEAVKRENLEAQLVIVDKKKEELDKMQQQQIEKLETPFRDSLPKTPKERLVESLKEEAKTQAQSLHQRYYGRCQADSQQRGETHRDQSIQRVATETAIENSVTVFTSNRTKSRDASSDVKDATSALEAATGVEIVVDDTPEAIVLSAFDPVRREIARLALHQLVTDGRIIPRVSRKWCLKYRSR